MRSLDFCRLNVRSESAIIAAQFDWEQVRLEKIEFETSGHARILLVDDDPYLLEASARILRQAGYQVIEARTGYEGIRLAIEQHPILILLDVMLPDLDGIQVCRQLKASPVLSDCLIVLLSAVKVLSEDQVAGLENLADGYITRPIPNHEFLARVNTFVRLGRALSGRNTAIQALLETRTWLEKELARRTAEIEKSRQQWEAAVDSLPQIVCLLDGQGNILRANRAIEKWGLARVQEVEGLSAHALCHSNCASENCFWVTQWPQRLAQVLQGEPWDGEIWDEQLLKYLRLQLRPVNFVRPMPQTIAFSLFIEDVTLTYRMRQVLQESEQRYRLLAEHTTDIISRHSAQGNYLYASPACAVLLGYSAADLIGRNADEFIHPDDQARFHRFYAKILEGAVGAPVDYRVRHRDGYYLWVETTGNVICDSKTGQVQEVVMVTRDVTERKRVENLQAAQLRLIEYAVDHTVEELLQHFLDEAETLTGSQIAFCHFVDEDQQILSLQAWSTNTLSGCQATGAGLHYSLDQAGVWVDCVYERKPVIHNDYARLPHRKGLPEGHVPVVRELTIPLIRGQKIVAILGVGNKESDYDAHDVETVQALADVVWESVARKRAQQALQKRDAMTCALLNATTEAAALLAPDGTHIALNEAMARLLGQPVDALIGRCVYDFLSPEMARSRQTWLEQIIHSGKPAYFEEVYQGRYIDNRLYPVFDEQGRVIQIAFFASDITERIEAETRLRDYADRLRALALRLSELEEAERQQLARELHDQVGQNLTALGINLNIIRSLLPNLPDNQIMQERLDDSLTLVEQTAERIRNVMTDLRPPVLDDYGLLAALHWYGRQVTARTGVPVMVSGNEVSPRLPPAIEVALFRIVQEAATNAIKHAQPTQIDIQVQNDVQEMRLIVADDGIGFDLAARQPADGRHGWGIMTMIERAEAVGAHCRIESQPGRGTRVIVEVAR